MQVATNPNDPNAGWLAFARRHQRVLDLSPASRAKLAQWQAVRDDAEHAQWLASGEPDLLADLQAKRKADRLAAEMEKDAIDRALRLVEMAADSTDEDCEAAEVRRDAATAEWRAKYDHLWPSAAMAKAKLKFAESQSTYLSHIRAAQMSVVPFPAPVPPVLAASAPLPDLIKTAGEFVQGFVPPEYLVDGVMQRRYFYSLTASTGVGKTAIAMRWTAHVVVGRPLIDKDVQQGTVLYFAGENPDDVRARWLVLTREMGIDPANQNAHFIVGAMDLSQVAHRISAEVAAKGLHLAMVVVDTAAAYNFGDDENSNTQAGNYARQLRTLTELPGGPCVIVLCHPTKRAADDDLLPRGGGAFLAEVDGNLAVVKKDSLLAVGAQGKFRGDTSFTLRYELEVVRDHPKLRDVRGRNIPSVIAKPVGEGTAAALETRTDQDTEAVLRAVSATPGATPTDLARALGWTYGPKAEPNRMRAKRVLDRLAKEKLVVERLGRWRTTQTGDKDLNAIDLARPATVAPSFPLPTIPFT